MNKSVALGMTLALLSATSFYAAADEHLIRVGFNPGRESSRAQLTCS
jgi:D-methionine transport system substrate-binding protein